MAKPYLLGVEIEEGAFGRVMRKIEKLPGVINLHLDFQKPRKPSHTSGGKYNGGAPRKQFDEPGYVFLVKSLRNKEMKASQMKQLFGQSGRSPGSYASSHHNAKKAGLLVRGKAPGTWTAAKDAMKKLDAANKE